MSTKAEYKLSIELVPQGAWYKNLRSELPSNEWDNLRRWCYQKCGYRCEICGGKGPKHPVECHELWEYDDAKHTQTLVGVVGLCPACHEVKHIGLAQMRGNYGRAIKHFCKVNECSYDEATMYIDNTFGMWAIRSRYEWTCNTDWLKTLRLESEESEAVQEEML